MSEYVWMCKYKHDSEYASGPKYVKTLNMAKLEYGRVLSMGVLHSVLNMPEYALTEFWILKTYTGF